MYWFWFIGFDGCGGLWVLGWRGVLGVVSRCWVWFAAWCGCGLGFSSFLTFDFLGSVVVQCWGFLGGLICGVYVGWDGFFAWLGF